MTAWNDRRFVVDEDDESPFLMEALSSEAPLFESPEEDGREQEWAAVSPAFETERTDVIDEQEAEGFASHATEGALARLEPLMEQEAAEAEAAAASSFSPSVLFESPVGGVQPAWRAALDKSVLLADIAAGQRSENDLTNKIFFLRHPEKKGAKIGAGEEALKQEWRHIHARQVLPCLLSGPYIGPLHGKGSTPPGPDLRKGVAADAVLSPLSITLRGLRQASQRQPGTIAAIVVHMTSRGPAKRSKASGYRTPAVQYALNHYINGKEGFPHYVIDFNGTIYATCDERFVAYHSGWVHPGGRNLFTSGWRAPEWWSRVWFKQGAKTPIDLLPAGVRSPNPRTIGVELMILPDLSYTAEQYRALARLVIDIRGRYPELTIGAIPGRSLLGHEDFAPVTGQGGRADARGGWDPGAHRDNPYFDWQRVSAEIQELAGAPVVQEMEAPLFEADSEDEDQPLQMESFESPFVGEDEAGEAAPLFEQEAYALESPFEPEAFSDEEIPFAGEEPQEASEDAYGSMREFEEPNEAEEEAPYAEREDEEDASQMEALDLENEIKAVVWAGLRQRIVSAAVKEWNRWDEGKKKETDAAMRDVLRAYWQNVGFSKSQADERIQKRNAWSAAFISWVMTLAGAGGVFRKSAAHYVSVAAAKRSRMTKDESTPFWAYRRSEVAPQPGDVICKSRRPRNGPQCSDVSYDTIDSGRSWPTHCDIVTAVRANEIDVIGGHSSVSKRTIPVDARGFLPEQARDGCRFIAIITVREGSDDRRSTGAPAVSKEDEHETSSLATLPTQIANMVRTGGLALKVALAMLAGERDVTKLTSMLFFLRHPERGGARIRPEEKSLAQEWRDLRDGIVKPALDKLSALSQPVSPQPPTPAPAGAGASGSLAALLGEVKSAPKTRIEPRTQRAVVDGYERVEPRGDVWCQQAGLTLDEGALARMIASEVGSKPPQYMLAVAEATINEARAKKITVFQRITMQGLKLKGGVTPKSAGYFGRQSGRWCASIQDPTHQHLKAARIALAATGALIASGARRWVDGKVMDGGLQGGKKLTYNAVTIVQKWGREGWEWVGPVQSADGKELLDPYVLMLFRNVGRGKANVERGVEAMQDGRRRWKVIAA